MKNKKPIYRRRKITLKNGSKFFFLNFFFRILPNGQILWPWIQHASLHVVWRHPSVQNMLPVSLSQNGNACSVFVADTSIVALSLCVWNEIIVVIHVACSRSVWCNTAANVYMLLGVAVSRITQTNIRIRKRDNTTRWEAAAKPGQGHGWTPQVTLWHCYVLFSLPKLTLFVNYCYFVILDNISKFI